MAHQPRVYILVNGKNVRSTNDYGQAVVDAHAMGPGTRITSFGTDLSNSKCVKIIGFEYPTKA